MATITDEIILTGRWPQPLRATTETAQHICQCSP